MTSIQPELWVETPGEAVAFYEAAFGATVLHRVGEGDDVVAQLGIGGAAFWVAATSTVMKRLTARNRWGDQPNAARGRRPRAGRPAGGRRWRDGIVPGQRRARLAAR